MLAHLGHERSELSVVLCDDDTIAKYNSAYRETDRPTDVLAFPLNELSRDARAPTSSEPDEPPLMLGDVIISISTAARQARSGPQGLRDEVTRLLAHGLLHLLGWDHAEPEERIEMERRTERLMAAAEPRRRRTAT